MGQNKDDFKRGTAELLVLHLLLDREKYGYELTHSFEERTNGNYTMLEGTLYPILYKLEDAGLIQSRVAQVGVRRTRKYYRITDAGREHYANILNDYLSITESIFRILGREDGPHGQ